MIQTKLMALILSAVLLSYAAPAKAGCDGCDAGCNDCCDVCPQCNTSCKVCELKVDEAEEDKHCWKVECKEICIPHIVFPWQKSCCNPHANNGACVRTVNVLKKHSYKCPTCEYSWSPKDSGCCGDGCCGGGGCDGSCDAGAVDWSTVPSGEGSQPSQPTPASDVPAVTPPAPPVAPSVRVPSNPITEPVNSNPVPDYYESTKKTTKKAFALPVRFLRAAKAKVAR